MAPDMPLTTRQLRMQDPDLAMRVVVERAGADKRAPWRWRIIRNAKTIAESGGGFRSADEAFDAGRRAMPRDPD